MTIPTTQTAVQLTGPSRLELNRAKPVVRPGPYQVLAKVEAVGLCFSDLKLLKQFDQHVRKAEVVSGVEPEVLEALPSYRPGALPTVPGHELSVRVVEVGEGVESLKVGQRILVQPDFRRVRTPGSNGAVGYNFEGALQEYILLDSRILGDPEDPESYVMLASESLSRSAVALVEPWACVENSYATEERRAPLRGGRMAVVVEEGREVLGLVGEPNSVSYVGPANQLPSLAKTGRVVNCSLEELEDEGYDDIVYFGCNPEAVELLNDKLAAGGILNLVLGGGRLGRKVQVGVGRIHYGMTRWVGTVGAHADTSYPMIPPDGEVRDGDRVVVVGAGGPMGQMHVIRDLALRRPGVRVVAEDLDDTRLEALALKVRTLGLEGFSTRNSNTAAEGEHSYFALMAPVPELVAEAVERSLPGAVVNVFAGIPSPVKHPLNVQRMIERGVFVFGTSGSATRDLRAVLGKVTEGSLDVNISVSAVGGMAGALDGLAAVEHRTLDGKIVLYPELIDLGLVPLTQMGTLFPSVAAKMREGMWCAEAEQELLKVAGKRI